MSTIKAYSYLEMAPAPDGIPFPSYYTTFMDWRFPLTVAAAYTIGVAMFNPKTNAVSRVVAKAKGTKSHSYNSGPLMTAFVFAHNMALCVYSAVTFVAMASALVKGFFTRETFLDAFCDRNGCLWRDALGYWGYLFYLSKYYEIIDTLIILTKGRRSSLLQTYHHAGAMITMWAGIFYQATAVWIFVVFNSFVHTVMYFYYALTSLGISPPGKRYLTTLQIGQFVVGTSIAISYAFVDGCAQTPGQRLAIWLNVGYLFALIYLFVDFALNMYGNKSRTKGKEWTGTVANGHANGHADGHANGYAKKAS